MEMNQILGTNASHGTNEELVKLPFTTRIVKISVFSYVEVL